MVLHGVARGGTAGGHPELAINRGQVGVDGAGTDDQALSHLLIGQSLCHYLQHLDLPGRQSGGRGAGFGRAWNGGWSCWSRGRHPHCCQCCQCLLEGHGASRGPGGVKGLLPQLRAHGSDGELVQGLKQGPIPKQGWRRRPHGLAECLGGTHEPDCPYWPVRPAEENYNVKLSVSLASQLRGRDSPFLTCAEWPFTTINCIFYPFMLLSHLS